MFDDFKKEKKARQVMVIISHTQKSLVERIGQVLDKEK